jgi:oligopeptide transport system substrate-binding protein
LKKLSVLMSVLIILSTILAACGATAAPTATPVPPTKAATAVTTAPTAAPTVAPTKAPTVAPTAKPAGPKVLRMDFNTYPDVADPQKSSYAVEISLLQLAYEGLTRLDAKGNVGPGAAEKWSFSADGKTITFNLRAGLKRADGTALTAKDFEFAFKRLVDPTVAGEYNFLIDDVVGAVEARSVDPKASAADIQKALDGVGIKATDDRTLVVNLKNPVGFWLYIASTWAGFPIDPKAVAADPDTWWTKAAGHNGNGPYKVSDIQESKSWTFVANPNYYGGKAKIDRIVATFTTDSAVRLAAYKNGEIDIIIPGAEDKPAIDADPVLSKEFLSFPATWVSYMSFHEGKPPFDNAAVRKAFSLAFDRVTFTRDILKGAAQPYLSWVPLGVPGGDETAVQLGYDPKAAVKTLIDAGFGAATSTADKPVIDCKKLGDIKLTYSSSPRNHARFQAIAGYFVAAFNCPITLDPVDATTFTALTKDVKTAPQFFLLGWIQDYPHPQNWLFIWECGGLAAGRVNYCNKDFDAAVKDADQTTDMAKSIEKYKAAQKIFLNDYGAAMLYQNLNWYLVKPYVLGVRDAANIGPSDAVWPGQYGPVLTYDIDLSKVGTGYPTK